MNLRSLTEVIFNSNNLLQTYWHIGHVKGTSEIAQKEPFSWFPSTFKINDCFVQNFVVAHYPTVSTSKCDIAKLHIATVVGRN